MAEEYLWLKKDNGSGLISGRATRGIESVAEAMKKGIKHSLKCGTSIRHLEVTTIVCWGNEVWRLKNIGRDKHKWMLVRVSDGQTYPLTI